MRQPDFFDEPEPYNGRAPSVRGSDTSEAAAESIETAVSGLRLEVLRYIARSDNGATCDEVEIALMLRHQTASARVRELVLLGRLCDTGLRRKTRSGRNAAVYRTTEQTK